MAQNRFIVTISNNYCKGCQLCVAVCPKKALGIAKTRSSNGHRHVDFVRPTDCIGCLQCADVCPDAAIRIDVEAQV